MNGDATEAALGLLGLSPHNLHHHSQSIIPLKRKQSSISHFHHSPTSPASPSSIPVANESISCICGFAYDDGFSIACDDCSRWCHAACFDIVDGDVPEEWRCWVCVPRPVDRDKAVRLQKSRQRQAQQALLDIDHRSHPRIRSTPGLDRKPRRLTAVPPNNDPSTSASTPTTSTTAKRKRRSSINASTTSPSSSSAIPTAYSATEDEHIDIDDPWTQSYVHITHDIVPHQDTRDKLRRQAQHWRGVTALKSPLDSTPPTTPIRLAPDTFPVRTSVQPIPNSSFSHPTLSLSTNPSVRPPSYALHTTSPVPSAHFIAPFKSTITSSAAYLSDPLNAYAHLGLPKPFVHLFGPPLDLTLDARTAGNKSRFLRNGCRPNAVLRPIICNSQGSSTLTFGVFALRDLKANEEVVLGWEWDDGHAVHSLPALIETPHMFPWLDSTHQILHLRHQMANILHALGSTFTTCACGARAKDCALNQMAAFVDGETTGEHVDLGPLVGGERGFLTREKVPWSGGMGGVEMVDTTTAELDSATEQTTRTEFADLPVLTFSPATVSPSPKKNGSWKGKERALPDLDMSESESSGHDDLSAAMASSSRPRYGKRRGKRRLTIDFSPQPSPISARQTSEDEEQRMDDLDEKQMMPPKMRKRWIHQALKDTNMIGSRKVSGQLGVESVSSEVGESERMNVDGVDPPPVSSSTSTSTVPLTDLEYSTFLQSPPAVSPSTSFAKLSLRSPITDDMNVSRDQHRSAMTDNLEPTHTHRRIEQKPQSNASHREAFEITPSSSTPSPRNLPSFYPHSTSPSPLLPNDDHPMQSVPSQLPDGREADDPSLLADDHDAGLNTHMKPQPEMDVDTTTTTGQSLGSPGPEPRPRSATPRASTPPPPIPPVPKVKMSLKDFAMRKKKQREEEEMAKILASPASVPEPLAEVTTMNATTPSEVPPGLELGADGIHAMSDGSGKPGFGSEVVTGGVMSVGAEQHSLPERRLSSSSTIVPEISYLPAMPPNGTHSLQDSSHPNLDRYRVTLEAKTELIEATLPRGLVGPDDREIPGTLPPAIPLSINGDTRSDDVGKAVKTSPAIGPPMHAGVRLLHHQKSSREDGEISGGTPTKQRPPPSSHQSSSFVPRSHSPPTQPRSFQTAAVIASTSSAPSVSASPSVIYSKTTPPPSQPTHRSSSHSSHSSSPATASGPSSYRHRSQSQSHPLPYSPSQQQHQQQQPSNFTSSRPLPRGPRALQNNNSGPHTGPQGRMYAGAGPGPTLQPPFIPRGPSADRERMDWDRDRGWSVRPRGRGGGGGGGSGVTGWGR